MGIDVRTSNAKVRVALISHVFSRVTVCYFRMYFYYYPTSSLVMGVCVVPPSKRKEVPLGPHLLLEHIESLTSLGWFHMEVNAAGI